MLVLGKNDEEGGGGGRREMQEGLCEKRFSEGDEDVKVMNAHICRPL